MSRKRKTIWATGTAVAMVIAALTVALLPSLLRGNNARQVPRTGTLIVHEWGTFTSFAGSDGVNLEFRPLVTSDLPGFVMTPYSQPGSPFHYNWGKDNFVALQRMETPVAYFYTDSERMVNVRVDFPKGMLTEWYPVVKGFDAGQDEKATAVRGSAYLDWGAVRLMPPNEFAKVQVRDRKGKSIPATLPTVSPEDHYGRARDTDSAVVETVDVNKGSHFEKFLFYRGLGNFELPIKLAALGNDRFEITNSGPDATAPMLLVRIDGGRVRFTHVDPLRSRSAAEISLPNNESSVDLLGDAMEHELTAAGLYEKEAAAMVNTWRSSWFGENGTRLLYLVPTKITDELLPLIIDPVPDERVRILVGRLETLTPEDCQRLTQALTSGEPNAPLGSDADAELTSLPVTDAGAERLNAPVRAELDTLGRFAEPAIKFLIGQTNDHATRSRLENILANVRGN